MLDCLVELGLNSFLGELANAPELLEVLGSNSNGDDDDDVAKFTLFAPSDEAFSAVSDLDRLSSREILGGHIVNGTVFSSRLREGRIVTPFDEEYALHVTTVFADSTKVIIGINFSLAKVLCRLLYDVYVM